MITEQLKSALLGTVDLLDIDDLEVSDSKYQQLQEYIVEAAPDLSGLDENNPKDVKIAEAATKEYLSLIVDKASELGFTDSELIAFLMDNF